jgi:hypothetical protein
MPGGRPGPGRLGFGARAGRVIFARRWRNPRRTRLGVSIEEQDVSEIDSG